MSIFSKLKTKGSPAENPPPAEFTAESNGPEISEDKSHSSNDERGRRPSTHIRHLINKILSGQSIIGQVLFSLTDELKNLFNCQAVSVYAIDMNKRQIYTRNFKVEGLDEIRLDISTRSLAGFVAATGKTLNITDVYNAKELKTYHPDLKLDKNWDEKINFKTKSALVVALPYNKRLMGVLECLNYQSGERFDEGLVRQAKDLSTSLGHAMAKLEAEDIESKIPDTTHAIHAAGTIDEILL